jgi:hypothetical protein
MIINIKDIPVIYINPTPPECNDQNDIFLKRKHHMENLLTNLKFKNIIHYQSKKIRGHTALIDAYIDLFAKYQPPFLLLEDDIECNFNTIPDKIEIPDNTDAFYFGIGNAAGHPTEYYDYGNSIFSYYDNNILKVHNMLGAHAVLYLGVKYMNDIRNTFILKPYYYNDVLITKLQAKYNVYSYKYCYFYQANKFGNGNNYEGGTKIIIPPNRISGYPDYNYTVTYVTSFLNINDLSETDFNEKYLSYFIRLANTGIPIVLFLDQDIQNFPKFDNVKIVKYFNKNDLHFNSTKKLPEIRNMTDGPISADGGNTGKDNQNYLNLMNNKLYFIEEATKMNIFNTNHYAWIDFRIFHIFKNDEVINNKLNEICKTTYPDNFCRFPGGTNIKSNVLDQINWRFLGGFFLIDTIKLKELIDIFNIYYNKVDTLSWEVNYWAGIEFENLFDFGWYLADHNESIITL